MNRLIIDLQLIMLIVQYVAIRKIEKKMGFTFNRIKINYSICNNFYLLKMSIFIDKNRFSNREETTTTLWVCVCETVTINVTFLTFLFDIEHFNRFKNSTDRGFLVEKHENKNFLFAIKLLGKRKEEKKKKEVLISFSKLILWIN